jgi:transcriptional regulator
MHPNRGFRWTSHEAMLGFVADVSFAHIFAQTPEGPRVAHAPVVVTRDGHLRFHLARANGLAKHLDGLTAIASVGGPGAYVSPDWYADHANQVPTWNYLAVEAEGPVRALGEDDLVAILDDLSAAHEARLLPKRPWTRAKRTPGRFEAMLPAITGFELRVAELRGTAKLSQNKGAADVEGVIAGLRASGKPHQADLVAKAQPA